LPAVVENAGNGNIALRAYNSQFVCTEHGGGSVVNATRDGLGPWETLTIVDSDERCGWEDIGGTLTSAPTAVVAGNGAVEVYAAVRDDALRSIIHVPGSGWTHWTGPHGSLLGSPGVAIRDGVVMRAVIGHDRGCYISQVINGNSTSWQWIGGLWRHGIAVTSWGSGRWDIWTVGDDQNLQQRFFADGAWSQHWFNMGGHLTSAPSGAAMRPRHYTVCARGTDNAIWERTWTGTFWTNWNSLDGIATSGPSLVPRGPRSMDLYVRGTDMALYHPAAARSADRRVTPQSGVSHQETGQNRRLG
jgi:hypothetical protein